MDTILTLYSLEFENGDMKLLKCYSLFSLLYSFFCILYFWAILKKTDLWGITESFLKNLFFQALPFTSVQHILTTIDCQPTTANGVLVFVVGQLKVHVLFSASLETCGNNNNYYFNVLLNSDLFFKECPQYAKNMWEGYLKG